MGDMNVPAPFDASQTGVGGELDDALDLQPAKGDGDEAGDEG